MEPVADFLEPPQEVNPAATSDQVVLLPQLEWTPKMGLPDVLTTVTNVVTNCSVGDSSKPGEPLYAPDQELNLDDLLVPAAATTSTTTSSSSFLFPCSVTQQNGAILHRYLGLTDEWLLNLRAHETKMNHAVVCKAKELLQIHKLKYRREESISLVFRDGERWNFEMAESYECVTVIKDKMNAKGVRGHKTNQASLNQLAKVQALIKQAQQIETTLQAAPTLERVKMIMDLYREATERLSSVSNDKQKTSDLTALLHTFLLRQDVQDILEGKNKPPPPPPSSTRSAIPSFSKIGKMVHQLQLKGQVLPRSESLVNSDEDDGLAREEKNLVHKGISQLKKMMDLNLSEPAGSGGAGGGAGERETERGRTESSASDMSSASSSSSSRTRTNTGTGSATDKALAELEVFLGDANRELESLQQSTTSRAAAAAAATSATTATTTITTAAVPTHQEEEEEIVI